MKKHVTMVIALGAILMMTMSGCAAEAAPDPEPGQAAKDEAPADDVSEDTGEAASAVCRWTGKYACGACGVISGGCFVICGGDTGCGQLYCGC